MNEKKTKPQFSRHFPSNNCFQVRVKDSMFAQRETRPAAENVLGGHDDNYFNSESAPPTWNIN